jgi:hypothetical protein
MQFLEKLESPFFVFAGRHFLAFSLGGFDKAQFERIVSTLRGDAAETPVPVASLLCIILPVRVPVAALQKGWGSQARQHHVPTGRLVKACT